MTRHLCQSGISLSDASLLSQKHSPLTLRYAIRGYAMIGLGELSIRSTEPRVHAKASIAVCVVDKTTPESFTVESLDNVLSDHCWIDQGQVLSFNISLNSCGQPFLQEPQNRELLNYIRESIEDAQASLSNSYFCSRLPRYRSGDSLV